MADAGATLEVAAEPMLATDPGSGSSILLAANSAQPRSRQL
jgi:hypothetical protein